jgi:preprotein translocase subunit YajC
MFSAKFWQDFQVHFMSSLIPDAMAQSAGAAAGGQQGQFFPLVMMGVFVVIFYMLLIRPQQKKQKEHRNMVSSLGTDTEVLTSGGLLGRVTAVGDDFVTVEIADGVRVKVQKMQIVQLLPKGTCKSA